MVVVQNTHADIKASLSLEYARVGARTQTKIRILLLDFCNLS